MPPHVATCLNKLKGTLSHVRPTGLSAKPGERDPKRACRCHGPHSRAYRGQCLPSFMIIGSQKAATSKLRWYLSRHAEIRIPKEENFHKGPPPVAAWDTQTDPALLSRYLDNLDDVCDVPAISALKMPDYIVMSNLTIARFYAAAPTMRIVLTLREPIARMYSYFSMQLRLGWSPINHMGKNPCMQRMLHTLKVSKEAGAEARAEAGAEAGAAGRRLAGSNGSYKAGSNGSSKSGFTSEEIMRTNLECVRPCYGSGVAGEEMWHDEARQHVRTPSPGGSGRPDTPRQGRPATGRVPPLPRVRKQAASRVADPTSLEHGRAGAARVPQHLLHAPRALYVCAAPAPLAAHLPARALQHGQTRRRKQSWPPAA